MLSKRVEAAKPQFYKRLQQISQDSDHHAERQVIEDALAVLRVLEEGAASFSRLGKEVIHAAVR